MAKQTLLKSISIVIFMTLSMTAYLQEKTIWNKSDSTWDWIGQSQGSIYLIKKTVETTTDEGIRVWIKAINSAQKANGKIVKKGTIDLTLYCFDCDGKRIKAITITTYNMDGKVIKTNTYEDYEQRWAYVIPQSVGEMLLKKACELGTISN